MRIIDKNTDFYDFYQGIYRDDSIVFDRTDSFELTKKIFCEHLDKVYTRTRYYFGCGKQPQEIFVLLQVCNTFFLFLVNICKITDYGCIQDYTIEQIAYWANYNKNRKLIKLDIIEFGLSFYSLFKYQKPNREMIINKLGSITHMIDNDNFKVIDSINHHAVYKDNKGKYEKIEKHIPLLKSSGLAQCVDPFTMYLAIEEYFSLEKSSKELKESISLTNNEKVENHGFDLKISFRGK